MALENANYIPELVETNPDGGDLANTLDDHDRMTKRCLKNSFPGFVGTTADPKSVSLTEDQINDAALRSANPVFTDGAGFQQNGNEILNLADPQGGAGAEVYGRTGVKRKVGFRNPAIDGLSSGAYTFTQDDESRIRIRTSADDITVPQLEADTQIGLLVGNIGGTIQLLEDTGVQIRWYGGTGAYVTGDRTIVGGSFIVLMWGTTSNVNLVGNGIS